MPKDFIWGYLSSLTFLEYFSLPLIYQALVISRNESAN
jgi:hypothetical protein